MNKELFGMDVEDENLSSDDDSADDDTEVACQFAN